MNQKTDTLPLSSSKTKKAVVKTRIFIVDDHPVTRQGVAALINQEPQLEVCGQVDSAPAAMDQVPKAAPQLAIIDITLKDTSGIELLKNLRALLPDLLVLVMSMHDESLYAERALRAGANGYIMKQEASEKILTAINCILGGGLYLSEKMKDKLVHHMLGNKTGEVRSLIDSLSDRELEVFQLIGNGYGSSQIAEKLNLSTKTIDSYRENIKVKLNMDKGSDMVRYAIQWSKSEKIG
ncbi:MAG TPA: response regulator transcription factor [Opitutaceae bacterium]|nr:response regulator transcription factor [Opitutaceae bacterium]